MTRSTHYCFQVKFIFLNTDVEENWQSIEYLGIIAEDIPAVLFIILDKGLTKFKMPYDEVTTYQIFLSNKSLQNCMLTNKIKSRKQKRAETT